MAWIEPVTNRLPMSRTTAEDMNRIANNIAFLGGDPIKSSYSSTDIVKADEWDYIVEFAQKTNPEVDSSTTYTNLNMIEESIRILYTHSKLKPSNTLLPSDTLVPNKEV